MVQSEPETTFSFLLVLLSDDSGFSIRSAYGLTATVMLSFSLSAAVTPAAPVVARPAQGTSPAADCSGFVEEVAFLLAEPSAAVEVFSTSEAGAAVEVFSTVERHDVSLE